MSHLFDYDRLDISAFCNAAQHVPSFLRAARRSPRETGEPDYFIPRCQPGLGRCAAGLLRPLSWLVAQNLSEDNYEQINELAWLRGSRFLVQAARCHSERKMGKLVYERTIRCARRP